MYKEQSKDQEYYIMVMEVYHIKVGLRMDCHME